MNPLRVVSMCAVAAAITVAVGCSKPERKPPATAVPSGQTAVIPQPPKPPPAYFRDHYAKLEDCVYDWGYAQKCTPVPPGSAAQQGGATFLGPIYARSYREETQVQLRREAIDGGYAQRVVQEASDKSIAKSEVKS